ncbi:MAG: hypothetical protein N2689_06050 [Verrucomicrobiae bacterium]|nr:hypothetical protein [Verrucomicrobiae bacterium]
MRSLIYLLMAAAAPAAGLKPGPPHIVAVETREYRVEFAGDRAWTIFRILHKGALVGDKNGFYGTVLIPAGGKFIGTGHTEGGVEKIENATLTVDGKPAELLDKAVYRGCRAELRKQSVMGPLRLEAAYIVTDDWLLERHCYEAPEDTKLHLLYAFMHCWLPRTTEWIAEKADGTIVEGRFDCSGDFKLREDVKWTALYDPDSRRAALAWFPKVPVGQGHRTAYWDKTHYHKLYTQLYAGATLPKGTKVEATLVVRCVEADASVWKQAVKNAAAETQRRFDRGEIKF